MVGQRGKADGERPEAHVEGAVRGDPDWPDRRRLLAESLALPRRQMDDVRWDYYQETGYSGEEERRHHREGGGESLIRHWKPFEAHAVGRLLGDHPLAAIDFGAGRSVFADGTLFEHVRRALEPFPNVILLLPSPDLDESPRILVEREPHGSELNEHLLQHSPNLRLAKLTIYSKNRTPEATRDEILRSICVST